MTATLLYNDANQLTSEAYSCGTLSGRTFTTSYDGYLRRDGFSFNTSPALSVSYGYDAASRLQTVTMGGQSATYSYVANSPLVEQIVFKNSTTPVMTTSKSYDYLNRLKTIASVPTADATTSFSYDLNTASQRVRTQLADGSYWLYEYDSLGQVKSGKRYWNDGTLAGGQQFEYAFDDIGNRTGTKIGGDGSGLNLKSSSYTANTLNQYTSRSVTGAVYVTGLAFATNTVTVGGQTASRKGEYFWNGLLVNNSTSAFWTNITTTSGGSSTLGNVFISKTPEQFSYDPDGNLTNDGRWAYTWDAENRLIKMEPSGTVTAPANSRRKLEFAYDYKGRRMYSKVTNLDTSTVLSETKCLYDGWNLVAELNMANALVRSFGWGLDLSGTPQGAGGVGGLLKVTYYGSQTTNAFVAFDGNGNVGALADAANGSLVARYEYGPFGEVLRATGPMAKVNPFRFSTKYQDDESDLIYYGYRYYNASTGRWPSRDPIGERGGMNSYTFAFNDSVNGVDSLGLHKFALEKKPGHIDKQKPWPDVPGEWMGGETMFDLVEREWVEKVKGDWYVRGQGKSTIDFWYSSESSRIHELHHVSDDESVWNEFVSEADPYIDKPFCSKKKAECFREVVEKLGTLYRSRSQQIGAQFDCDEYDRAKGGKLGRCALAAKLKPENDAYAIYIGKKILECEAMK